MASISVITICLNDKVGLEKTIQSVLTQTYKDFEFIVIDGGSTDGSTDVINKYSGQISYWVSEKDTGIYNAMNKGLAKATGDYLLFLNAGDYLADTSVIKKIAAEKFTEDIVYGDIVFLKNKKQRTAIQPDSIGIIHMIRGTIYHPGSFIKRDLIKPLGGYDESFKIAADYNFFVRSLVKEKSSSRHVNFVISIFDEAGISSTNKQLELSERKRIQEKYFTQEQINDAAAYNKLVNSFSYRVIDFIGRNIGMKSLARKAFKVNYY